jgi:hypothetical protein
MSGVAGVTQIVLQIGSLFLDKASPVEEDAS